MPHHKSALKRLRQTSVRQARNVHIRTRMRSVIKKLREAIDSSDATAAQGYLKEAIKVIDTTRTKGVIHRRNASRKVSRLTRAVNNIES